MKNFVTLLLLLIPIISEAQTTKFDKLIDEFDVAHKVKDIEKGNPTLFWDSIWRDNKSLTEMVTAREKGKQTFKDAQKLVFESKIYFQETQSEFEIADSLQYVADSLLSWLGVKKVLSQFTMQIVYDDTPNACACPDGLIYLNDYLFQCCSIEEILGICAHEATHVMLWHTLASAFAQQKRLQRNKILAGITATVSAAADGFTAGMSGTAPRSQDEISNEVANLFDDAERRAVIYRYKYSREQEVEADIVAYRFLEYLGLGGDKYINALKAIDDGTNRIKNDKYDNHPTTRFRIELLEYLSKKESTGI